MHWEPIKPSTTPLLVNPWGKSMLFILDKLLSVGPRSPCTGEQRAHQHTHTPRLEVEEERHTPRLEVEEERVSTERTHTVHSSTC